MKVFFPITLSLLSGALLLFVDRVFISRYSLESLEACATAASICMFLQVPFMRIASMINPMIGNLIGGKKWKEVGSSTWQMIWFSLFSSLLALPMGLLAIRFVLQKTFIEILAVQYLQIILPLNFTFVLGVVLSSFFIAIGRRWIVLGVTLISHLTNIVLNYLLIFGIHGVISPLGIKGAAIGTVVAQVLFCVILFSFFQNQKHHHLYQTRKFKFNWQMFLPMIKKWGLFGMAKLVLLFYWLIITRIMLVKGESATLVLSIGCTLFGSLIFLNDGVYQAIVTSASQILGTKAWHLIWKLVRSSFLLIALIGGVLFVPCIAFREKLLLLFVHETIAPEDFSLLMLTCIWMWCFFLGDGTNRIFNALITASGDSWFNLIYQVLFELLTLVVPVYLLMFVWDVSPDKIWMLLSITAFLNAGCYFFRAQGERWKERTWAIS